MPQYSFTCSKCNKTFEKFGSIKKKPTWRKCSCGGRAIHNFVADHSGGGIDSQMREYSMDGDCGMRMYPAAVLNKEQLSKARKQHPGFDWKRRNGCWLPVIHNRTERKQFLKQKNWVEY